MSDLADRVMTLRQYGEVWVTEEDYLKLEAKLAKAAEALRKFKEFDDLPVYLKRPDIFEIKVRKPILQALAELTGGKDE